MNTLDLELLRSLVAIAKHDSFAAAAVELDRTQSAVTHQMQRLEEYIGHPLFEKQGRHKRLSGHGERLLAYARHMLSINDEALRNLRQGQLAGVVRIGAPHDVADNMLPPLLTEMARSSPMLQLDIHVGRSPYLMESLHRGELDMAISNRVDDSLEGVLLRTSPTVWLCSASYVHDIRKPVPVIVADGPSIFRKLSQDALNASGLAWEPRYTSSSLIGIRAALRAGLGVTARSVELLDAGLRLLGPGDGMPPLPPLEYRLYVRSHVLSPVTRQVFDHLKNSMARPAI